jgi:hypothetical protein
MNKIAQLLVLGVLVTFLSGTIAQAEPAGQKVKLKNGKMLLLTEGKAMVPKGGKFVPAPNGVYKAADGRIIEVNKKGNVIQISKPGAGPKPGPKSLPIRNEELRLKDGTRAYIKDGRLWVVVNQHGGQKKASSGNYMTKDGRKIIVKGGGKIEAIHK